jgi:nicotinate-nucleotide--dimethylbenzimidazole phosphoribosyltransferase
MTTENEIASRWDAKTKPPGSLGRLESIAAQLGRIQKTTQPSATPAALLLFAGDHGVHAESVSPYPQAVTAQMVMNIATGGAASSVLAKLHHIDYCVYDVGVASGSFQHPRVHNTKIRSGTRNMMIERAMTEPEMQSAVQVGRASVRGFAASAKIVLIGEMGIANTTSASAITCALLNLPANVVAGAGAGLDATGIAHKVRVIDEALALHMSTKPFDVLQSLGGYEIAAMTGAYLEAYESHKAILVDGFIATVALLVAVRINPHVIESCIFSHLSQERGHRIVLDALSAKPLLDLGMRLGEGTGALTAYPLMVQSCALLQDMATFESASVDNREMP